MNISTRYENFLFQCHRSRSRMLTEKQENNLFCLFFVLLFNESSLTRRNYCINVCVFVWRFVCLFVCVLHCSGFSFHHPTLAQDGRFPTVAQLGRLIRYLFLTNIDNEDGFSSNIDDRGNAISFSIGLDRTSMLKIIVIKRI